MRIALNTLVLAGVVVALACSTASNRPASNTGPSDSTTLGPGDVFDVRVFGEDDFAGSYRVDGSGKIRFPLIGEVEVQGLEPPEVSEIISARLRDAQILLDPQVTVFVTEYESKKVIVTGAVTETGSFPMRTGLTVVEAISLAGGFTPLAQRNDTVVSRREAGELKRYRVRVDAVTRGEEEDFSLQPGDIVYVPERVF